MTMKRETLEQQIARRLEVHAVQGRVLTELNSPLKLNRRDMVNA